MSAPLLETWNSSSVRETVRGKKTRCEFSLLRRENHFPVNWFYEHVSIGT